MNPPVPVFIAHDDGTFREHITRLGHDDQTACGIRWSDLPDIVYTDGSTYEGDKPWYVDHERDDVVLCEACPIERRPKPRFRWPRSWTRRKLIGIRDPRRAADTARHVKRGEQP